MSKSKTLAAALLAVAVGAFAPAASGQSVWLVAEGNFLVRTTTTNPTLLLDVQAITGLPVASQVVGIDFRPRTGQLVAAVRTLAGATSLFRIDPRDGVATAIGGTPFADPVAGTMYGLDFNPTVDLLRVVSDLDVNLRVDPADGTLVSTDTALDEAAVEEEIVAIAYDRSFPGTTATTLFGIDADGNQLVMIGGVDGTPSPNGGVVTEVAPLSVTLGGSQAGLDITNISGLALASLVDVTSGLTNLYTLDLATGGATSLGAVGNGIARYVGLAAAPETRIAIAAGAGKGEGPHVRLFDAQTGLEIDSIIAFDADFNGGVRIAMGDVNADGVPDVIAGAGKGPRVRVFDGTDGDPLPGVLGDFQAFDAPFKGGVFVAAGDVNGDGNDDVIVGADKGKGADANVKVFSGADGSELQAFFAFSNNFNQGVRVASADLDDDGNDDIIAVPGKGKPRVQVYDGGAPGILLPGNIGEFDVFSPKKKSGLGVAAADVTGDGIAEIFVSSGNTVRVYNGATATQLPGEVGEIKTSLAGAVDVGAVDVDGDGIAEIVVGAGKRKKNVSPVKVYDGETGELVTGGFSDLLPFLPAFKGGVYVAGSHP